MWDKIFELLEQKMHAELLIGSVLCKVLAVVGVVFGFVWLITRKNKKEKKS